jgi:hypothetical protein
MTRILRRALYWVLRPVWRLLLRTLPPDDPWGRLDYRVPVHHYGLGSRHDFAWYFEGDSAVTVSTLDDIQEWLLECEYVRDSDLFHEPDFWQHPRTFERLRKGDCEDHALWAWRKLLELNYDAELVAGRRLPWDPSVPEKDRGHVWVLFRHEGQSYLFEAVAKAKENMVRPLAVTAAEYRPEFGVDRSRQRFTFNGILLTMREREFGLHGSGSTRRTA